jgi:general secretion pathway protein L
MIILLPLSAASPQSQYPYIEGPGAGSVREASAPLLPPSGINADSVAVVPAAALSWHAVDLPAGKALNGQALRALLVGLLEERLLDDVQQLHFALQPEWQTGQKAWVAVCNKAWLQGHLQALEAADRPVSRVLPELSPQATEGAAQLSVTGTPEASWLWVSAAQGVWGLPLPDGLHSLSPDLLASAPLSAEPAVVEWTQAHFKRPAQLKQRVQRLRTAAQSDWDLAQFELAATGSARWRKTLARVQQTLWQSSAWRPARWGVAVLLLSQLLGLNAWAWKLRTDLRQRQDGMAQVMKQTFPEIQVVLDAPLQMSREVQRLRQAAGQVGSDGLEPLLAALGPALPVGTALSQLDFQSGQLRLKDLSLTEAQAAQLQSHLQSQSQTQLQAQPVQARREGAVWVITAQSAAVSPSLTSRSAP